MTPLFSVGDLVSGADCSCGKVIFVSAKTVKVNTHDVKTALFTKRTDGAFHLRGQRPDASNKLFKLRARDADILTLLTKYTGDNLLHLVGVHPDPALADTYGVRVTSLGWTLDFIVKRDALKGWEVHDEVSFPQWPPTSTRRGSW